jgi:cell wall assembly regulator SMI1
MVDFQEGSLNGPADPDTLSKVEARLNLRLPTDFRAFMLQHDGCDAWVGESRLCLWPLEELPEANNLFEMETHMPTLRLFGGDGGGEYFAFDITTDPWSVVAVPTVGMAQDTIVPMAPSFSGFIERLAAGWTVDKALDAQQAAKS